MKRNCTVIHLLIACGVAMLLTSAVWILIYFFALPKDKKASALQYDIPAGPDCPKSCNFTLTETIPVDLTYNTTKTFPQTFEIWKKLIDQANSTIDIVSFYWSMLPNDTSIWDSSAQPGIDIFEKLIKAAKQGVKIRIMQDSRPNNDTTYLQQNNYAEVRSLNFIHLLGSGVLHTKMWLVDKKHLYIGSANLDWRALTQVKELGVGVFNCDCIGADLAKQIEVYWAMGAPQAQLPQQWPLLLATRYNSQSPMIVNLNNEQSAVYITSSPPEMNPLGRENDITAIVKIIKNAQKFVHISVMDYAPNTYFMPKNNYWPVIDDALRAAAYDGKQVKLLISKWDHTYPTMFAFLDSLASITPGLPCLKKEVVAKTKTRVCLKSGSIIVRIFQVPIVGNQSLIPYARVNHNKYMVTDNTAYIGTSNWSGNYFITTAGSAFVVQSDNTLTNSTIVQQLNENIFMRDWNSAYASPLSDFADLIEHPFS